MIKKGSANLGKINLCSIIANRKEVLKLRASPRALVSWVSWLKKEKEDKKSHPTETLSTSSSILIFYPGGAAGHLWLALSASHPFLDFEEVVGFHPLFSSYFVLNNSYIRILTKMSLCNPY